jgi:hypothetical protein
VNQEDVEIGADDSTQLSPEPEQEDRPEQEPPGEASASAMLRQEDAEAELGKINRSAPSASQELVGALEQADTFRRRLCHLLGRILCRMPIIVGCGFCHFVLGFESTKINQLMIEIADFTSSVPRFMWFIWYLFFVYDWALDLLFTTEDLHELQVQELEQLGLAGEFKYVMLVISWASIAVSTAVLGLRFFRLRPMLRTIGFSYAAPKAREEENQDHAEKALALDRKLGFATTFGEDFPQAALTLITAFANRKVTWTMGFSLATSVSTSSYVVYDLVYKNLWNPDAGILIDFFDATGGTTSWKMTTNWKSHKPLSEWFGVTVDKSSGHVIGLDLADNGLKGRNP